MSYNYSYAHALQTAQPGTNSASSSQDGFPLSPTGRRRSSNATYYPRSLSIDLGKGKGLGFISSPFYAIISEPIDQQAQATILGLHRQLLNDQSSIYQLLREEDPRETFILCFQEQCSHINQFLRKIKVQVSTNRQKNAAFVAALLKGLLIPLFAEPYHELLCYDEMLELTILTLEYYILCSIAPEPGSRLLGKISETTHGRLLERLVADPTGEAVMQNLVGERRYGQNVFKDEILTKWNDRLGVLAQECKFPHDISGPITKWRAITKLQDAYPQQGPVVADLGGLQSPTEGRMGEGERRLSREEAGRRAGQLAGKRAAQLAEMRAAQLAQRISVPFDQARLFEMLGVDIPTTFLEAQTTVKQLGSVYSFEIFQSMLGSFPCSACHGRLKGGGAGARTLNNHTMQIHNLHDSLDPPTDALAQDRIFKGFGRWRIILSRLALKDLAESRKAGNFKAVETKLRELATGNWERRRALTKQHRYSELPVPLRKAVYDDNGRILWHVYVAFDETVGSAAQVLLVWRIGDHKEVAKSVESIAKNQKTFGKDFIEACKLRVRDPSGTVVPRIFDTGVLEQEHVGIALTRAESLDVHNAIITAKFFTLTQVMLDAILASGENAEFPFDLAHEEVEIIRQSTSSSFILGRSGTGKTTCLAFKLLSNYLTSRQSEAGGKPVRQVFLTRSEILAGKLKDYIPRLIACQLGHFDALSDLKGDSDFVKEKDYQADTKDLWSLTDDEFPLVCTFDSFIGMVERSIKMAGRKFFDDTDPKSPTLGTADLSYRLPREVDFATFQRDYWNQIPGRTGAPLDLVFSEIMGVIKGSSSSLSSLQTISREDYVAKGSRIAGLFQTEAEREQVYSIFKSYERLKEGYRDWDGIDRAKEILIQMEQDKRLLSMLQGVVEEIYVDEIQDQRLLEIELLFKMVPYPRGIHLAGDSAQCISRDSTFRFADIKSLFYGIFQPTAAAYGQTSLAKPQEFKLAKNYRSHQGIVALGALIVQWLCRGFPDLIDKLLPEIGRYSGPAPIVFCGFTPEETLGVQSWEDQSEDQSESFGHGGLSRDLAEFGADQVVLVRDEQVQEEIHSRIGSQVLILTILQSKGMEFEDVVLLNFFSASPHKTKYRGLHQLLDDKCTDFDAKKYSILCSELKTLYVGVTRCRANLRIVEENSSIAELIIKLWTVRVPEPLVQVVYPHSNKALEQIQALRSGSAGSPSTWRKNGLQLMEKKLYKQALFCFKKAELPQLQALARGHILRLQAEKLSVEEASSATDEALSLFRRSSALFLKAEHPHEASKSLEAGRLYTEAADIWRDRNRPELAAPLYEKGEEYLLASQYYHEARQYSEAATVLRRGKKYEALVDYLERYQSRLQVVDSTMYKKYSKLCVLLLHQGKISAAYKDKTMSLLGSSKKVELFCLQRGYTEDVIEIQQKENRLDDAFNHLVSVGQLRDAVFLAPFHELVNHVPRMEVQKVLEVLLIGDLRVMFHEKDNAAAEPPAYADPWNPSVCPDMPTLWGALHGALMDRLRIELLPPDSLKNYHGIPGYMVTRDSLHFIAFENIETLLSNVNSLEAIPIPTIRHCLDTLTTLVTSKAELVPDDLIRYFGAYKPSTERASYVLLPTSPLNTEDRTYKTLSQTELYTLSRKHFTTLVMKSTYAVLDKARILWSNVKPSRRCTTFTMRGECHREGCKYPHIKLSQGEFGSLFREILYLARIVAKLGYFYIFQVADLTDEIAKQFRPQQRYWLERLYEVLTYVTPFQQDMTLITESPISNPKDEQYELCRYVRHDLDKMSHSEHAKKEWNQRNSFSQLLEQVQRAQQLGDRSGRFLRIFIENKCKAFLRTYGWRLHSNAGLRLFVLRPQLEANNPWKYEFHYMASFLREVAHLDASQLTALPAVLSLFERIATYLLLLDGADDSFLILSSWRALHLPVVGVVYSRICLQYRKEQRRQGLTECLVLLMKTLLTFLERMPSPQTTESNFHFKYFKSGGDKSLYYNPLLMVRRTVDIICTCYINMMTLTYYEIEGVLTRLLGILRTRWRMGFDIGLGNLPNHITPQTFVGYFIYSFRHYENKEGLLELNGVPSQLGQNPDRFHSCRRYLDTAQVPRLALSDIQLFPNSQAQPTPLRTEDRSHMSPDTTSEGTPSVVPTSDDAEDQVDEFTQEVAFTEREKSASRTILRIWQEYWPLHKERAAFKKSLAGKATAIVDKFCDGLRHRYPVYDVFFSSPRSDYFQMYIHQICFKGPAVYAAIMRAEKRAGDANDCYVAFFASLQGSNYSDSDLEKANELFEAVEVYRTEIEELKTMFSQEEIPDPDDCEMLFAGMMIRRKLDEVKNKAEAVVESLKGLMDNDYVREFRVEA